MYDTNKNDAINVEQFADILKSLKIETDSTKLEELVQKVDKNHDGQIDFDEFVSAMTSLWGNEPENTSEQKKRPQRSYTQRMSTHDLDDVRQCFEKFDTNGDGTISFDELKEVMHGLGEKLTEQELKDMMTDADTNKNGLIDFDEFKALIPSA